MYILNKLVRFARDLQGFAFRSAHYRLTLVTTILGLLSYCVFCLFVFCFQCKRSGQVKGICLVFISVVVMFVSPRISDFATFSDRSWKNSAEDPETRVSLSSFDRLSSSGNFWWNKLQYSVEVFQCAYIVHICIFILRKTEAWSQGLFKVVIYLMYVSYASYLHMLSTELTNPNWF